MSRVGRSVQTHQQREDFRVFVDFGRLNVHEMDVQALNLSLEMRKLVQELLAFVPFGQISVFPVADNFLQVVGVEAVLKVNALEWFSEF